MEVIISSVSFVELVGWIFFLYCMKHINDKIPLYIISSAILVNVLFNLVIVCKVYTHIRNHEHIKTFKQNKKRFYKCIRMFSLLVSHRGFYMNYYNFKNKE